MKTTFPIRGCRTTRIYCRPGCPPGKRTKLENRVYFHSQADARLQGYRACKVCKPDQPIAEIFRLSTYHNPLGEYWVVSSLWGIVLVKNKERADFFLDRWERQKIAIQRDQEDPLHARIKSQLDAYFQHKPVEFTVPLDLRGTPFQRRVWDLIRMIPYGQSRSYASIAGALGKNQGARAVGRAVGNNPVSIAVPCHRVLGSDGSLTGYGGGLTRKAALLQLEGLAY